MPRRYGDSDDVVTVPGKDIGLTLQLQKLPVQVECDVFEPEFEPLTWSDGETDKVFISIGGWIATDWEEYPFPLIAAVKGQWPIETAFTWTVNWESTTPPNDTGIPPYTKTYLNAAAVTPSRITELGTAIDDGILTLSVKAKTPTKTVTLGPITMTVVESDC